MSDDDGTQVLARFAVVLASLNGHDPFTARLCEAGRQLLDADGASMTLDYSGPARMSLHTTDQLSAMLDDLQDVVGEGPGFEASRSGEVVLTEFDDDVDHSWPLLRQRLQANGFRGTVVSIPLRAEVSVVGVMTIHRQGSRRPGDLNAARFLGATIGTALLQHPQVKIAENLDEIWGSRAEVHQATGMVVAQIGVHPEDAFALLKGQAFARGVSLADVAADIVRRRINFRDFTIEGD